MAKAKYTFNEIAACITELQDVTNKHYDSYALVRATSAASSLVCCVIFPGTSKRK
jgi:hypothetical protein